ncbi:MAG: hypothetical protein ACE5FL_11830 [Myxococcota bacterium]
MLGISFGFAAAIVELWLGLVPFVMRHFGPEPISFIKVVALETGLGALLGLLAAPLLKLRGGAAIHGLGVAALWYTLERWLAARWRSQAPWIAGAIAATGGLIAPPKCCRETATKPTASPRTRGSATAWA